MKRGGFLKRYTPLRSSGRLRQMGRSETSVDKREIQRLVREIVMHRDGGCILNGVLGVPACGGYTKNGEIVLQADHLITRANSATYDDTRLIVCVCKGHHGWKKWNENQYDAVVRTLLSPERVALWDRAEQDRWRPTRRYASDWKLSIAGLRQELKALQDANPVSQ